MSSGFVYGENIRARGKPKGVSDKTLKRILIAVAVLLGAELIWLFGISPCMPLSRINISGIPGIDRSSVLALAGIGEHTSFMTVNPAAAEKALLSLPMVFSARVIRRFPGRVDILLESRKAAAMAFVGASGRLRPALIDGSGMIFSVGKESFEPGEPYPVISGLDLAAAYPGMKLPRMYGAFFRQLEKISREAPELLQAVSEITINQKNYDGFDITLYPVHSPIKVRMGQDVSEETLRYLLLMLDVLASRPEDIEEVDFRTGTASYKLKEAYSG